MYLLYLSLHRRTWTRMPLAVSGNDRKGPNSDMRRTTAKAVILPESSGRFQRYRSPQRGPEAAGMRKARLIINAPKNRLNFGGTAGSDMRHHGTLHRRLAAALQDVHRGHG